MEGFVNYYIEEPQENYTILRGEKDVYKFTLKPTKVVLTDLSNSKQTLDFATKGLTYTTFPTKVKNIGDTLNSIQKEAYEEELKVLINENVDNVQDIIAFDHTIRSSNSTGTRNSPAIHVHGDYDQDLGIPRMKNLLGIEKASEWFNGENYHVGIINVWRPLNNPVEKSPLGHIDVSTVRKEDWKKVKIEYGNRIGNIQGLVHNPNHKWLMINHMSPDQVWIFCQFDSNTKMCVPHSAIDVVGTKENAKARKSIESRCMIRYRN